MVFQPARACVLLVCAVQIGLVSCARAPVRKTLPTVPVRASVRREARPAVQEENSDRLLMSDASDLREKANLSRMDAKDDLDLLVYALRSGYGGRKFLEPRLFSSVIARLEKLQRRVKAPLSTREFLESIDEILYVIPDNHLQPRSPTTGLSKFRQARMRIGKVGRNVNKNPSEAPWAIEKRTVAGKDVSIISLAAMPAPEDPGWRGFKESVEKSLASAALVIDLRGNGGGSDVMGAWLASRVLGHRVESPYESIERTTTLEALALATNSWKMKILFHRLEKKPVPSYYEARLKEKLAEYEGAKLVADAKAVESRQMVYDFPFASSAPYQGRVVLLIDAECASSCESVVEFFEQLPTSLTVGENTAGSVHFANPGILLLPHSQILIPIASDFWRYKDGRMIERIGYKPKVPLTSDALDAALKLLEKNL